MDAPEFRKWPLKIFKNFFLKSENFHAEKHQRYGYMKISKVKIFMYPYLWS